MTDRLRLAAQALLDRLTAVHADPAYESVWVVSQMHVGPYAGPTYTEELDALRRALAEHAEEHAPANYTAVVSSAPYPTGHECPECGRDPHDVACPRAP